MSTFEPKRTSFLFFLAPSDRHGHFARTDQLFLRVHVQFTLHRVLLDMFDEDPRCKIINHREGKQNLEFSLKIIVALEMVFDDDNDHVKELPF